MAVLSYEEFRKRRENGESYENVVAHPNAGYQKKANSSGILTYEQFHQARQTGRSFDDILSSTARGQHASQKTAQPEAPKRASSAAVVPEAEQRRQNLRDTAGANRTNARTSYTDLRNTRDSIKAKADDMMAEYDQRISAGASKEELANEYARIMKQYGIVTDYDKRVEEAYAALQQADKEYKDIYAGYNAARKEVKDAKRNLRDVESQYTGWATDDLSAKNAAEAMNNAEDVKAARTRLANAREAYIAQGGNPDANIFSAGLKGSAAGVVDTFGYLQELALPENEKRWGIFTTGHMTDQQRHHQEVLEAREKARYEAEHGAGTYVSTPGYIRTQDTAARLARESAEETASMKAGRSQLGQFGIDMGVQMGADAVAGKVLPGGSLTAMALRTFGSGVREARENGANIYQQGLYGAGTAAVEVLTEKMFDGLAGVYGAGAADDIVSHAIGRFAQNRLGQAALGMVADAAGEGLEEVISDLANPILRSIYDEHVFDNGYFGALNGEEILYDFLVGAAMGFIGGSVEGVTKATGISAEDERSKFFMQAGENGMKIGDAMRMWQKHMLKEGYAEQTGDQGISNRAAELEQAIDEKKFDPFRERKINRLNQRAATTIAREDMRNTLGAVEQRMQQLGEDNSELAEAVTMVALEGEAERIGARDMRSAGSVTATEEQRRMVAASPIAQRVLSEMDVENLRGEQAASATNDILAQMGVSSEELQRNVAPYQRTNEWVKKLRGNKALASDVYGTQDTVTAEEKAALKVDGQTAKIVGAEDGKAIVEQNGTRKTVGVDEIDGIGRGYRKLVAAAANGVSGEAMLRLYNPGQDVDAYTQAWNYAENVYGAQTDVSLETARTEPLLRALTDEQLKLALEIGRGRREATRKETQSKAEKRKATTEKAKGTVQRKKGTVSYEGGEINGVKYKGADRSKFNRQQKKVAAMVEALADAVNLDYMIVDGEANTGGCYIQGGAVVVNINSGALSGKTLGAATLSHELTHHLQDYAPEQYEELKDFIVAEILKQSPEQFDRMVKRQIALEPNLSYDAATDEVIANACQKMLLNSKAVEQLARQNMTLAERIADWISETADKIKAAFEDVDLNDNISIYEPARAIEGVMDEVQKLWDKALIAANENYNAEAAAGKKKTAEGGGVQFMAWDRKDINRAFIDFSNVDARKRAQVSKLQSLIDRGKTVTVSQETIDALEGKTDWTDIKKAREAIKGILKAALGNDSVQFTFDGGTLTAYITASGRDHAAGGNANLRRAAMFKEVKGLINNAEYIYSAKHDVHSFKGLSLPADTEWDSFEAAADIEGTTVPVIFSILTNSQDVRSRIYSIFADENGAVSRGAGLQTQVGQPSYGESTPNNSIAEETEESNAKNQQFQKFDSSGKKLTDGQQEYFADSKIRDGEGRLKVMYRGGASDITVFDRRKSSYSNLYGRGFYFTDSESHASQYGKAHPYYLNITNPLQAGAKTFTDKQIRAFLEAVAEDEDYGLENYGYGATVSSVLKGLKGKDDFGVLSDINATCIGDLVAASELFNEVNGTNIDGIVTPTETVAFRSDQIKETDNENPTSNPDTRFQKFSSDELQAKYDSYIDVGKELTDVRNQIHTWKNTADYRRVMDNISNAKKGDELQRAIEEYGEWERTSGFAGLYEREKELSSRYDRLRKEYDDAVTETEKETESEQMEKSGKSEGDFFRDKAVKEFGYTPYFYDAGYIVPNGKMLNFSGEKGRHFGSRGQDHRAISTIFTGDISGSEAMLKFMGQGNIRIMAETPGIDISKDVEPTKEQYAQIRKFASQYAKEEYFGVDFTDERGNTVGSLEYDGRVRPDRVVNDIKYFYQTGEVREQGVSQFYQKWGIGETEAEQRERKESFDAIKAQNKILKARAEYWRSQTRQTKENTVRKQDTDRLANELLREYSSRAEKDEVKTALKELGDWLVRQNGESLSYDELYRKARSIAEDVIDGNYALLDDSNKENLDRLKDFLKGTALNLSASDWRDTGDETFRRRYGRYFSVSESGRSIDSAWGELAGMFGEGLFPEDVYAPGDMLNMIGDYLDLWRPQYGNEFEQNRGEAVEWATGEIIDAMLSEDVRQTPGTFADKAQQKLNAQIAKDREKLDALRAQKNARIEQLRREAAAKNQAIRTAEKAAKYEAVSKVKRHYLDMMQRQRGTRNENAGQSKYRAQVKEKAAALQKMLQTNSDKLHVPEVLKAPLAEFLSSIDFSSKSMLRTGKETQADRKFQSSLAALSDILSRQERNLNGDENADNGLDGYLDMSQESMDYLREMTEEIHKMLSTGSTFTVNSMTAEQLQGLSKLLSNITSAIRGMNNFLANERYATVREAADADIKYMDSLGSASDLERSGIFSAVAWKNGTPYYVLKRFGNGGTAIFESFTKGWEQMARNIQEVMDFTQKTYTDKEVKAWKNETHEIELTDGSKIQMTTAQIMAFSVLTGREQAMKHIEKGGIRIGDIKQKVGKRVDTKHYHLSVEDMAAITGKLTARQAEVAKKLQHYMALKGAAWGNEVSMRRFGYNFYDEGDAYFPIRTDSNDRGMQDTDAVQNSMFRLLNLSASKSLNPKASNALIVDDIFDVFADHMSDMAKLNGMGLPILDAIKWFNYKERIDLGDGEYDTRTLMGAMDQAFGDQAQRYFRTLMKDINGVTEAGDRGTDIVSKLMGSYKAASVGANLRVALLQPTSYVRASALISPQYLLKAFTSKNAYKEALENSGTALWKSLGYYDTNISRGMREQIKHDASFKDQLVEKSMTLAELGDRLTWGRLWVACKMQTKAQNPQLNGQDLINKTADLFRETIYATQVMDSTLTRSELMRGKSLSDKAMTSFMAEPTLSYNMLLDAASDFRLDVREKGSAGALQRNAGKITRAFSVYAASAAFAAVVESLADAVRDDDEDDFWQKFLDALFGEKDPDTEVRKILGGNLAQDLTILGKLPYLKSFISTLQGYKSKDMSIEAFNSVVNAAAIWKESIMLSLGLLEKPTQITYNGNMTTWGKISKTLQALSQLTGLPGYNMTRDATALWNTMVGDDHPEMKVKTYRSKSERIGIYFDALREGDTATAEQFNPGYSSEKDEQAALKSHIHEMYLEGDMQEKELVPMLMQYSGMTRRSAEDAAQQWKMEVDTGIKYGDLQDSYVNGDVSRVDAVKYYKKYSTFGHTTQAEAEAKVLEWQCEKDTGIAFSDIGTEVKTGRIGKTKALQMVMKYGGKSEEATDKQVEGWLIEHEYNITPSELQEEYMDGNVSVEDAYDILVRYKFNGKEDADEKAYNEIVRWNFIEENPGTEDITVTQIQRYQNSGLVGVVDGKSYLDAYEATSIMTGVDTDGDGKTDRYSVIMQKLEYIDSMNLAQDQKTALAIALGINEKTIRRKAPWM